MRVESMGAQAAVLARATRRATRPSAPRLAATATPAAPASLPRAIADRLDSLFADDPGLAEAVYARLPAARQASALDLAAYTAGGATHAAPRIVDTVG